LKQLQTEHKSRTWQTTVLTHSRQLIGDALPKFGAATETTLLKTAGLFICVFVVCMFAGLHVCRMKIRRANLKKKKT
jgi:hypothetical protein